MATSDTDSGRISACIERCGERAWRLACAFVGDPVEAHDVVQQACLVLARKADRLPAQGGDPWPFFAGIVALEARNARRKRRPLTGALGQDLGPDGDGEDGVDPVDPRAADPAQAAARAETHAQVALALEALPDRQREALLLTHAGGLSQAEAAAQLGLPLKTVGSHVKRGLDRLRARLGVGTDQEAIASLALLATPAPPGGLEAAIAAWREAALGALGAATKTGGAAAAIGGGLVTAKHSSALVVGIVSLVAGLAGGVVLDRAALAPVEPERPTRAGAAAPASDRAATASAQLDASTRAPVALTPADAAAPLAGVGADADERVAALVRERDALRARVAVLEGEVASVERARDARRPVFTFGKVGAQEFVAEADWPDLASAHLSLTASLAEVQAAKRAGEPPAKEAMVRLQESSERMRRFEFSALGRMGSVAEQNGETTHPVTIANLIAALLQQAGRPLTPAQIDAIAAHGDAFERDVAAAAAAHPEGAPRAARLLDEYTLKDRFRDRLFDALDPAQRDLVIRPADREVAFRDLWCPTLMLIHTSTLVTGVDLAQVVSKLPGVLGKRLGLEDADVARLGPLLDAWSRDVSPALAAPVGAADVPHFTCEQGRLALEAGARLYAGLAALLPAESAARKRALDEAGVPIPRLVVPEALPPPAPEKQ